MIEHLKRVLKQEDTVLFIGSGISLWSGLPTWSGLIEELANYLEFNGLDNSLVKKELKRGELLQAASYGFDKLTKQQIAEFIRNSCKLGVAKPHEIHRKIVSLGPKCFITTNYDKLIELSFQKWLPDTHFRTVINRQLTETAGIVAARASNFLFKLHGDAEDSESIILTREQYRTLNIGGELHHALETVKTLMVSRPIVYLGFGLRDPDFLYVKDLLENIYKGGTRDHYAILADVDQQEKDYWRRNYGIHLINYDTSEMDGKRDYSQLLSLLDNLVSSSIVEIKTTETVDEKFILSLTRHVSKYIKFENVKSPIPLIVHPVENNKKGKIDYSLGRFYGESIENLLDNGPQKQILIGLPGGGKSYALRSSVARFASELNKQCIEDTFQPATSIIPIFADLKLYKGSLIELLEQSLPVGMNLSFLLSTFRIKIFLDAFNEIPREYIETNHWNSDFARFVEANTFTLVISSRTSDGLENLDYPIFNLDSIDEKFIENKLAEGNIEFIDVFKSEMFAIIRRPIFYKLIYETGLKIGTDTTPQKIYHDLMAMINSRFHNRFQLEFNLVPVLSMIAIEAIDAGEEIFELEKIKKHLTLELNNNLIDSINPSEIINWLISQDFLISIVNERLCFFHQSVTEYLAATRLANIFIKNPEVVKEKLSYRRWDQALFLAISLLDKGRGNDFLKFIMEVDFELALSSVRYMEGDTREIVDKLLQEIENTIPSKFKNIYLYDIAYCLKSKIPVSDYHITTLKKIINFGDSLGGAAVVKMLDIQGDNFKENALDLLVKKCEDFNFCRAIGSRMKEYISENDLPHLLEITNSVQKLVESGQVKDCEGFTHGIGNLLEDLDPILVFNTFFKSKISKRRQKVHLEILDSFLMDCMKDTGLQVAANLLAEGATDAASNIYFITEYSENKDSLDYSIFSSMHLYMLLNVIKGKDSENAKWALGALRNIALERSDFIPHILREIENTGGMLKAALYYATSKDNYSLTFKSLDELCKNSYNELSKEPFSLISHMDKLPWQEQTVLIVKLLKLRNIELAYNLCDIFAYRHDKPVFILEIGSIKWWLDWFVEVYETRSKEWIFEDRVSAVIANYIAKEKRKEFIDEFNLSDSPYRKVLSNTILKKMEDLSINELNYSSISFLLKELKSKKVDISILTNISTEAFVSHSLLPLFKNAKGVYLNNLKLLLEAVGKKHGRRYLV